jgi:site-specific DNA-methyltransferase (adenine-specific)
MTDKVALSFRDRNPDVLTSIANLSNDEVFTPPEFANRMLDLVEDSWAKANQGEVIWTNPGVKFLDPFSKSGVFLREITRRLSEGLAEKIPNVQTRIDHITKNQVFGIAITQLTSLLSRRSVYCSKYANGKHSISRSLSTPEGNIWFERKEHTWVGGSTTIVTADKDGNELVKKIDGRCKFCGASQKEYDRDASLESHAYALIHTDNLQELVDETFGEQLKFDVVIGNPPYQLSDGEDVFGASPIYHSFVTQAKALDPKLLTMVIPARWYSGGKGLESFRQDMLQDSRIRVIEDFPDSNEVFPGTQIKGGVCIFLWDRDSSGDAKITNHLAVGFSNETTRPLLEKGVDVFLRYNASVSILKKVMSVESKDKSGELKLADSDQFMSLVGSAKPFGFRTYFKAPNVSKTGFVKIYQNGGSGYVDRKLVEKNQQLIDSWKVFIPAAGSGSDSFPHPILGQPFVGEPMSVCSETYNCIGPFNSKAEAENVCKYISTRLFRFLVLLHKSSQHANRNVYTFVPKQDFSIRWTDEMLKHKYGITEPEWEFIVSMIRPVEA